ncbi:MAG TPA: ABC transporter permease [Planctomycetota bacterium]|nr:ABC transporter permease [Planctomycetota bacterium]
MSRWRTVLLLAGWEFRRFFKWKGQLVSWSLMALSLVGLAVIAPRFVERAGAETTALGLVGELPFELPPAAGLTYRRGSEQELRHAYAAGELGALLTLASDSRGTLESRSEGGWIHGLQSALDAARRTARLAAHGLDPAVLEDVAAPFDLHVALAREGDPPADAAGDATSASSRPSEWERIVAFTLLGFMFLGVFLGTSLLFAGITSEKQQLVTEQIVAAVPPQAWIDGKILGTALRSMQSVLEMAAWSLLGMLVWRDFVNPDFAGLEHVSPGLVLGVAVLAALGFALWFCFFAAVAATIDDPNTSSRGMLLLLPVLAPALAIPAYQQPDGGLALFLSLFPPTAPIALTIRLVIAEVALWELLVAGAGLVLATALLRRAAGRVFAIAILMRGKELSWREMGRAARASA